MIFALITRRSEKIGEMIEKLPMIRKSFFIRLNGWREKSSWNSGVTIVELLIAMGLISLLLMSLTSIFVGAIDLQLRSQATSSRQEDAQYILSRLFYDVNQASAITTPSGINTQTNSLVLTVNGQTWTFALSNGDLVLTNPEGTFQLNSHLTQVTQFDVKRVGNASGKASVEVSITVGSRIEGAAGNDSVSYKTTYSKW